MIDAIAKVTLYVNNQQEAKDFWINKLGFRVRSEQPMGPGMTWLEVGPEEKTSTVFVLYEKAMMQRQNPDVSVAHPSVILRTGNLLAAHRQMKENGVRADEIVRMPYGSMFTFYDMDGNMFLLREES